jgi:pheromone shutdown-related protein TraB
MKENLEINGKNITIVGTAHISQESRDEVRDTIETVRPDLVAVELDQSRFDSLSDDSGWKDLEISEAIRDGKGNLLLLNLILSIYQRKLGLEEGMKPGAELMAAVDRAEEMDIEYALVDQDINKTLNRAISSLSPLDKLRLVASMILPSDEEEMDIDSLKDGDMIGTLIQELEDEFPELKKVFLNERNTFMAEKILEKEFDSAVVVVGAAHVEGLKEELKKEKRDFSAEEVNRLPWMKIANYGFTALVFLGLGFSFYSSFEQGINNLGIWIGANSILAMMGAMIARSHPLTWIISFIASPLTSVNPVLPAGLVAAYSEAKINSPKVEDLETITDIESYRELWDNQVGIILLTFLLVNLGSGAGALISGLYILLSIIPGL